jgi:hypothetical protein
MVFQLHHTFQPAVFHWPGHPQFCGSQSSRDPTLVVVMTCLWQFWSLCLSKKDIRS